MPELSHPPICPTCGRGAEYTRGLTNRVSACPNGHRWAIPSPRFAIGHKRGVRGHVFAPDGVLLGKIEKRNRVAAGTGGKRGTFYTASVTLPDGTTVGASLGTRHPDRWSAARAIRAFHDAYTIDAPGINLSAVFVSRLVTRFKSERWQTCALPYQTIKAA